MSSPFAGIDRTVRVDLASLVGIHVIDARAQTDGAGRAVYYRIDGIIHAFIEDPDDDYRSSLREVMRWDHGDVSRFDTPFAVFEPIVCNLILRERSADPYTDGCYIIAAINERTGLVMFEVGTDNIHDWYPSFVSYWHPDGSSPAWLTALNEERE